MKKNITNIILLASVAGAGYYFYKQSEGKKQAASKISIEPEEKEEEEETPEEKQSVSPSVMPSVTPSSPAYALPSAAQKASAIKLTRTLKKGKKAVQTYKMLKKKKVGKKLLKALKSAGKTYLQQRMQSQPQRNIAGLDNCIGLF